MGPVSETVQKASARDARGHVTLGVTLGVVVCGCDLVDFVICGCDLRLLLFVGIMPYPFLERKGHD